MVAPVSKRNKQHSTSVAVPPRLAGHIRKGHPWIFADSLSNHGVAASTGAIVNLTDLDGRFLGEALYEADSPLALRVVATRNETRAGPALWRYRVRTAWELRQRLLDRYQTNAFRLLHGEGDRLPGVIADCYAGFVIMKLDSPAWLPHLAELVEAIEDVMKPEGIYFKGLVGRGKASGPGDVAEPRVLAGAVPPEDLEVMESGLRLKVNVFVGQKTGLFLDQRENRALVRGMVRGLEVLNCHAYTGGFSLAAVAGGATRVTSVDLSRKVIDAARENFVLNGFDPEHHEFAAQDAEAFLKACAQERRQFDAVIVDPPSLAMRKLAVHKASRAYVRLNERAIRQVKPGGFLATSSCSTHITMDRFLQILREAAAGVNKPLRVLAVRHEPPDHPTPLHFPEGHYLKFVLAAVETTARG